MKKLLLTILFLLFSTAVFADSSAILTWQPNSESDLAGYNLYQSDVSGNYEPGVDIPVAIIPAGTETVTLHDIPDGTCFWVLTAFDVHDLESGISNEATKDFDTIAPEAPVLNIAITVKVVVE